MRWANTFGGHAPQRAISWSRNALVLALTNAVASEHILSAPGLGTVAEAARTKKPRVRVVNRPQFSSAFSAAAPAAVP